MNKCKDCSHFEHPDKIECELERWPWSINGEKRGWCHKINVSKDRVIYGYFVTPNTETDCPYFKYDPRNWDGISESVKERFELEDWADVEFEWIDEVNDSDET